jgi:hypothetical protein
MSVSSLRGSVVTETVTARRTLAVLCGGGSVTAAIAADAVLVGDSTAAPDMALMWWAMMWAAAYGGAVGALTAGVLWLRADTASSARARAMTGFVVGATAPLLLAVLFGWGRPAVLSAFLPLVDGTALVAAVLAALAPAMRSARGR